MVERRKVQKTGSSSYIVTLPKDWVDSTGLKAGDYLLVYQHGNRLIITPAEAEIQEINGQVIVHGDQDVREIFRVVVAMYLAGYNTISIEFRDTRSDLAKKISELKHLARVKLAGVEVVDETYNMLVLKILLNLQELPLMRAIRRLHLIVNNMLADALTAFRDKDTGLAEAVIQRDDEADRFHFMITRQLSLALLDIRIMHELGIGNPVETINYRILARNLERIADHAVNISRRAITRPKDCYYCFDYYEIGMRIQGLFNEAMDSIYKLKRRTAEEVIQHADELAEYIRIFLEKVLRDTKISEAEKTTLAMTYDSFRRIIRYSSGIAEAALNIKASRSRIIEIK